MKAILRPIFNVFALVLLTVIFLSCAKTTSDDTVWIYTSTPPFMIEQFNKAIKTKLPDIDVQWFQAGSEKVAARIAMEMAANDVKANLVITANYFWYDKLAEQGFWENYQPQLSYPVPKAYKHPQGAFGVMCVPAVVLAYNTKFVAETEAPQSFKELSDPKWKSKVSAGSPLESGTNYSLMMNLTFRYGYDFLKALRQNDFLAAGGNSNTIQRLVSGERPVAILLLEHAMSESQKNPNIKIAYPQDGLILMPGPIAIVKSTKNMLAAKKLYDFFLSPEGQKVIIDANIYSLDTSLPTPDSMLPYSQAATNAFEFSDTYVSFARREEAVFKNKFSEIMFE